ncbi:MAG: DNA-binding response regulator, partial [Flavonifractor plautii]
MQIALCDDEERQIDALEGFLRAYEAEYGLNLTLTRFSSGEALLAAPGEFSIVFMDIYLDGLLGTETIRRLGGEAQV